MGGWLNCLVIEWPPTTHNSVDGSQNVVSEGSQTKPAYSVGLWSSTELTFSVSLAGNEGMNSGCRRRLGVDWEGAWGNFLKWGKRALARWGCLDLTYLWNSTICVIHCPLYLFSVCKIILLPAMPRRTYLSWISASMMEGLCGNVTGLFCFLVENYHW